ncbi:Isotocin-neurophysin IT 1, partial [Gryllus bimaculatus]
MAQFKLHSNIIVLMMILTFSCACMIINCPRGGKRSAMENNEILPMRNCARCGPNNTGHCYGPSICCAEELGCLLGGPEAQPCAAEALSPDPCVEPALGPRCFGGRGFCATSALCCTQGLRESN